MTLRQRKVLTPYARRLLDWRDLPLWTPSRRVVVIKPFVFKAEK